MLIDYWHLIYSFSNLWNSERYQVYVLPSHEIVLLICHILCSNQIVYFIGSQNCISNDSQTDDKYQSIIDLFIQFFKEKTVLWSLASCFDEILALWWNEIQYYTKADDNLFQCCYNHIHVITKLISLCYISQQQVKEAAWSFIILGFPWFRKEAPRWSHILLETIIVLKTNLAISLLTRYSNNVR